MLVGNFSDMQLQRLKKSVVENDDEGMAFDRLMKLLNQIGERKRKTVITVVENNLGELVDGCIDNNDNNILLWYATNLDRIKYANDSLNANNLLQTDKDIITILQYGQALYWDKIFIALAAKIDSVLSKVHQHI